MNITAVVKIRPERRWAVVITSAGISLSMARVGVNDDDRGLLRRVIKH
jgi:hypothetical protein